ncbi:hypothetical protein [Jiangella alkaliphila]|uniref:Uncharacterized protein n=1 Tax=Jiangella alkaliphila TaxID=419479 RepID=A0A1H2K4F0_9ACTN|nr:hypothetical protein [Jiangella alkaliphila]SDU63577.1 hypothetical protein SAMN04488563_3415 [Jiangella alkaliphila]
MAVGFRSFLSVETAPCIETVIGHLDRWSRTKEIRVDAGAPGRYLLDPDDVITIDRHEAGGRSVYRWRRLHPYAQGRNEIWRTSVTAVEAQGGPGWLWTEIEAAEGDDDEPARVPFMSVPAVLRALLADLRCRDGIVPSATEPTWVASDGLPDLMDYLADEGRLGPVYVARQGARDAEAFHAWATQVMWEVVGLGNAFLLGGQVEEEFNDMVGELHAIPDAAIRTYLPGVQLDDPRDPRRHQILGAVRIDRNGPRRLAYIFGLSQRDRGGLAPLPPEVADVEQLLAGEAAERHGAELHVVADVPVQADSAQHGGPPVAAGSGNIALSRRAQHRRLVELLEENEQLRAEVERLRGALGATRHSGVAMLTALETLEEEVRSVRRRFGAIDGPLGAEQRLTAS